MSKPIIDPTHPDYSTSWLNSPKGCGNCRYCSIEPMDMDPVCNHPVTRNSWPSGIYIASATQIFCGNPHTLWRKK